MSFQGVEVEVTVPCGENHSHPLRLRYTDWKYGSFEVVQNPCQEKLGPTLGEMTPCMQLIQDKERYGYSWERIWNGVRYEVIEKLASMNDPQAIPMLLGALQDDDPYISFMAAELLGNFSGNVEAAHKILGILSGLIKNLIDGYSGSRVNSDTWQLLLAGCAALAKMGVKDPTVLARLRTVFFRLAMRCYEREEPPAHILYALRAVGAVLSLTGTACDAPFLYSVRLSRPRRRADEDDSEQEYLRTIAIRQMQMYWQNFLNQD